MKQVMISRACGIEPPQECIPQSMMAQAVVKERKKMRQFKKNHKDTGIDISGIHPQAEHIALDDDALGFVAGGGNRKPQVPGVIDHSVSAEEDGD